MTKCAKCGKLTWDPDGKLHKIWQSETSMTEFNGKCLCLGCCGCTTSFEYPKNYLPASCSSCHFSKSTTRLVDKQSTSNSLLNFANAINSVNPYGYHVTLEKESVSDWYCSKFDFPLYDMSKAKQSTSFVTEPDYQEKCLKGQMDKEKANIQIILDFSSLKGVMAKGGLVMSSYKCPNCNVMVKLPEAGKVLMCEYCGTPIKPVDIFEKIKSLIQ